VGSRLADSVVELLLERGGADACVAGEVIADGIGVSGTLRSRVVDHLFRMLAMDDLDTGAAVRVLAALAADPAVSDRLAKFAEDPEQPHWVRADVAEELCEFDRQRGARLLRSLRKETFDTWLRRRILLKLVSLGAPTDAERAQAQYEFTVAQSGAASMGARAGEWFSRIAQSTASTLGQRMSAALALAERRDDGWQPLVEALLVDPGLSADNRFQAARRLSADPAGAELLHRVSDHNELDVRVPVLAALSSAQDERARQILNQLIRHDRRTLAERFPHLDAWREEVGQRSSGQRRALPPRNPYFAGREEVLEQVQAGLARGWVCLTGFSGMGKTAVALEYAYRHQAEYGTVWWAPAESDLPALSPAFPGSTRDLVIIDDAQSVTELAGLRDDGMDVLITSGRLSAWQDLHGTIPLDPFTRAESVAFLNHRLRVVSTPDAEELAMILDDLPLALAIAAATIASGMTIAEYLQGLRETTVPTSERLVGLALATLREEQPAALELLESLAMFGLALAALREEQPAALELLESPAMSGSAQIPIDVFKPTVLRPGTRLGDLLDDEIRFNRAARQLERLALITVERDTIAVPHWVCWVLADSRIREIRTVEREIRSTEIELFFRRLHEG
jgi:hypothetical protein